MYAYGVGHGSSPDLHVVCVAFHFHPFPWACCPHISPSVVSVLDYALDHSHSICVIPHFLPFSLSPRGIRTVPRELLSPMYECSQHAATQSRRASSSLAWRPSLPGSSPSGPPSEHSGDYGINNPNNPNLVCTPRRCRACGFVVVIVSTHTRTHRC